jgi:hypothetical protein
MPQDPVRVYKDALEELDEAYNKMKKIRRIITDAGQMLVHPYEVLVRGTDVRFPSDVGLVRTPTLDASDWPSAKQVAQVLVTLHEKYRAAQGAWAKLSDEDRATVEKLPDRD